jgi:cell wall-associated NlpC family hydrolase
MPTWPAPAASSRATHRAISLFGVLIGIGREKLAAGLTVAVATAALGAAAPAAAAEAVVPWGAGCTSVSPSGERTSSSCGASLVDGRAIAPPNAPATVKRVIAAANHINGRPYVWGGGHLSWRSRGYDCSGAVGYALHAAGLLDVTMVSGQLARWGESGIGRWISVYANSQHVFMMVAGLRFDTRDAPPGVTGPRWHRAGVDPGRFVARHPAGL